MCLSEPVPSLPRACNNSVGNLRACIFDVERERSSDELLFCRLFEELSHVLSDSAWHGFGLCHIVEGKL